MQDIFFWEAELRMDSERRVECKEWCHCGGSGGGDEWGNRREVCFEFGNLDLGYRADEMSQSGVILMIT